MAATLKRYGPVDSSKTPRFTGVCTFMRLPYLQTLDDVDVAVIGVPIDDAVSFKSGARFGPEAIRSASALLRPYNQRLRVDVTEHLSMIDHGDAPTVPGYHEETLEQIQGHLEPVHRAGVTSFCLGGDHSMALAELRAAAAVHGRLALVHLDAHADVGESYYGARYFHGTVFKRAVEEGLVLLTVSAGGHARHAVWRERHRGAAATGVRRDLLGRVRAADSGCVRRPGARTDRSPPGVPFVRHRLRRSDVRAGHGHAGGGRAVDRPGAGLPARAARD